jgi:hypothetical protein
MSETKLALTVESNWQDSIDQQLQERLMRPLVQPGLTNTTQLARVIISRSHRLSNRLPLLTELNQRLSNVTPLQAEQTPIVYAQSLPGRDREFKSLAPQEGEYPNDVNTSACGTGGVSPVTGTKRAGFPPQKHTVSAKVGDTSQESLILQNSPSNKSLIVQAKFAPSGEVNFSPKLSQNSSRVADKNTVTQLTSSGIQRKDNITNNLIKGNSRNSLSSSPNERNNEIDCEKKLVKPVNLSLSQLGVNGLPSLQAKLAPSIEPTSPSPTRPNSQNHIDPRKSSLPVFQVENGSPSWLERQPLSLLKQQTGDSIFTTAISNTATAATSQLPQQFHQLHVSSNDAEAVKDEHHLAPSLPVVTQIRMKANTATAATSQLPQQFHQLHVSSNGAEAVKDEHPLALPVVTQIRMKGWTGLETPLILPTSPRSLELGIAANGNHRLATQQYSAGEKSEILRATEGRNAGTVSRPAATVSQNAVPNVSAIAGFQEPSFSPATTGNQTQIDMDVLADKIERKLMRRLVVENERRGQKRWR